MAASLIVPRPSLFSHEEGRDFRSSPRNLFERNVHVVRHGRRKIPSCSREHVDGAIFQEATTTAAEWTVTAKIGTKIVAYDCLRDLLN